MVYTYIYVDNRVECGSVMVQVKQLVFSEGERYPILVDGEGVPDFWVTLYVTENLRVSLKQTSIENTIRHLIHLKLWEEINGRDLISEFSQAKFLSDSDIISIRDHCLLNSNHIEEWQQFTSKKNVVKLSVIYPGRTRHRKVVSKGHAANRLVHIASYLYFVARTMLRRRENFITLTGAIDDMKKRIIAQKPKGGKNNGLSTDPDSKAPPPEVFEKLMKTVRVDSPENPYKNSSIRNRNALMFDIMYDTGMRTGEILGLQIGDIEFQRATISVVRRHDNPEDHRRKQSVPKTSERDIPITQALVKRIRDYVMEERSKVPGANKGPFLFVTHKRGKFQGKAISDSTFRIRILMPAILTNLELFSEIHRHGFRHDFNNRLSKKIDEQNRRARIDPTIKPINEKEELQLRKYLNGWSSDNSAEVYNLRHIKEMSNKLLCDDMNDMSKHLNKEKK